MGENQGSSLVSDGESPSKTRVDLGVFLAHLGYGGKTRAALEAGTKLRKLFQRSGSENFYAAIAQITNKAGQMELFRGMLRKKPEAHTLHGAGHEVPLGLSRIAHGTRNCNREVGIATVFAKRRSALEGTEPVSYTRNTITRILQ
jgi:hypothetical protein